MPCLAPGHTFERSLRLDIGAVPPFTAQRLKQRRGVGRPIRLRLRERDQGLTAQESQLAQITATLAHKMRVFGDKCAEGVEPAGGPIRGARPRATCSFGSAGTDRQHEAPVKRSIGCSAWER